MLIKVGFGIYLTYITYIHLGTLVLGLNVPLETYLELSSGPKIGLYSVKIAIYIYYDALMGNLGVHLD